MNDQVARRRSETGIAEETRGRARAYSAAGHGARRVRYSAGMISTLAVALLVAFAHMVSFSWYTDRTPSRKRALGPLIPVAALTAIAGAVAAVLLLMPGLHRTIHGTVARRYELPMKGSLTPLLTVREASGWTVDVAPPRELWLHCAVGDTYARESMARTVRCGALTTQESVTPVEVALGLWGVLAVSLGGGVMYRAHRARG